MKLPVNLSLVDVSSWGCSKPLCNTGSSTLHRHHLRHEAMWLGVWRGRRSREKRYHEMIKRYHSFDEGDWVRLCDHHHAEIHSHYDKIIQSDREEVGKNLSSYSWKQAKILMDKLEAFCIEWLKRPSKGLNPSRLLTKRRRRKKRNP